MTIMTGSSYSVFFPKFSPNGGIIIFNRWGSSRGVSAINNFALSQTTDLTLGSRDQMPGYSSDGSKIVFERNNASFIPSIHTMNPDGTNQQLIGLAGDRSPNWYLPAAQNAFSAATTTGQNILIADGNFALSFGNVTAAGNTVVSALNNNQLYPLPGGYALPANAPKYEIATAAEYTDNIAVTFNVPNVPNAAACNLLRILHFTGGAWDAANNLPPAYYPETQTCTLRQVVTSLSPFVVAQQVAPTSASVSVSGRVKTASGKGVAGALITLTDSEGVSRTIRSGTFGTFEFTEVPAGETYVFSIAAKRYSFHNPVQTRSVMEDIRDVDFIAEKKLGF